ncbi:hypothetical protein N0V90_003367 [Kalmusia sp. IMI 367209]|nr:hypothetical protein N0V90_003367 [Kalmusia sp. IMI 367209]
MNFSLALLIAQCPYHVDPKTKKKKKSADEDVQRDERQRRRDAGAREKAREEKKKREEARQRRRENQAREPQWKDPYGIPPQISPHHPRKPTVPIPRSPKV